MITGIVAIAENFAVGKDGNLPWHHSADLKFFKRTTGGKAVVMGFNTWKSIGKPLPNRLNIILSRSSTIENQPNVLLLGSAAEVLALTKYLNCDLFIIGGAQTYESFADAIEKWIVTEVPDAAADADTFMPKDFLKDFRLEGSGELSSDLRVKIYARLKDATA